MVLFTVLHYYFNDLKVSDQAIDALDLVCSTNRKASTSASNLVLVLFLLMLQVFRRLYECLFINQASKSTMNITHYIVGYAHYFCAATGYVCESPGFVRSSTLSSLSLSSISPVAWVLCLVFLAT